MTTLPNRRPCEIYTLQLFGGHEITVSLGRAACGHATEVFFDRRGLTGQGLDLILQDLATQLSRIMQKREPRTGAAR